MPDAVRVVFDTNVLVSALLIPGSRPRQAIANILASGTLLFSEATLRELVGVLHRDKLTKYITRLEIEAFVRQIAETGEFIVPTESITGCRDSADDKFLELAVAGSATAIVTGDDDLLVLDPFRHIPIMTVAAFLEIGVR